MLYDLIKNVPFPKSSVFPKNEISARRRYVIFEYSRGSHFGSPVYKCLVVRGSPMGILWTSTDPGVLKCSGLPIFKGYVCSLLPTVKAALKEVQCTGFV